MRIFRFPFTDESGAVSGQAQALIGPVTGHYGRDFSITYPLRDNVQASVQVTLIGDCCFIPEEVPPSVVAEVQAQLAPFVESLEDAQRRFLGEVFRVTLPA